MGKTKAILTIACTLLLALAGSGLAKDSGGGKSYGVYEMVVQSAQGTFDDLADALESAATEAGWEVLATFDVGTPKNCDYHARVFVLYDSAYAAQIMQANRATGPFAVVDRINLFEDEDGTHVSVVNPHSINRTILMDDTAYEAMTEAHLQAMRKMITGAVPGTESHKQYGQARKEGYISKTMGVMAGGKFIDMLKKRPRSMAAMWQT